TDAGSREYLSVLRASDGKVVSRLDFNKPSAILTGKKQALYYGLACGKAEGGVTPVYAARGGEGRVSVLTLDGDGMLADTGRTLALSSDTRAARPFAAGLAVSGDGKRIYAAD